MHLRKIISYRLTKLSRLLTKLDFEDYNEFVQLTLFVFNFKQIIKVTFVHKLCNVK